MTMFVRADYQQLIGEVYCIAWQSVGWRSRNPLQQLE